VNAGKKSAGEDGKKRHAEGKKKRAVQKKNVDSKKKNVTGKRKYAVKKKNVTGKRKPAVHGRSAEQGLMKRTAEKKNVTGKRKYAVKKKNAGDKKLKQSEQQMAKRGQNKWASRLLHWLIHQLALSNSGMNLLRYKISRLRCAGRCKPCTTHKKWGRWLLRSALGSLHQKH
jgi:hypothetical protein